MDHEEGEGGIIKGVKTTLVRNWSQETPNVTSYYKQQRSVGNGLGMRLVVVHLRNNSI